MFRQCLHDGVTRITYVVVDHPLSDCRWMCLSPPVHSGGVGGGGVPCKGQRVLFVFHVSVHLVCCESGCV